MSGRSRAGTPVLPVQLHPPARAISRHLRYAPVNLAGIADFVAGMTNVEHMEALPFHQMGKFKWEKLGLTCPLPDTQAPIADQMEEAARVFQSRGLPVW